MDKLVAAIAFQIRPDIFTIAVLGGRKKLAEGYDVLNNAPSGTTVRIKVHFFDVPVFKEEYISLNIKIVVSNIIHSFFFLSLINKKTGETHLSCVPLSLLVLFDLPNHKKTQNKSL